MAEGIERPVEVQVFGTKKSADTRKALRFFSERRVKTHFVDFAERGPSLGELRRFVERFGVDSLLDRTARRFAELGLAQARYSDARWQALLVDQPLLIRIPLVRYGTRLTVGLGEAEWRAWLSR